MNFTYFADYTNRSDTEKSRVNVCKSIGFKFEIRVDFWIELLTLKAILNALIKQIDNLIYINIKPSATNP